jgi:tetratricopeptide (TPR) repeat protein
MNNANTLIKIVLLILQIVVCSLTLVGQDVVTGKVTPMDESLNNGFDLLTKGKYADARIQFEAAQTSFTKTPEPSQWLFTKIRLPDENEGDATSKDPQIRQITGWRHTMGTKQAITTFLALTSQLQGDRAAADKYFDAIYKLQSVLWGVSWRAFIPPIQSVFHLAIPQDSNETYARYLYLSGLLLEDAGEDIALTFFERAQKMAPKDPEIAANLASSYLMKLRVAEAKALAQTSLAVKPQQGRVLIDLATAEWMLGELDNAEKHASEAAALLPQLPGPHVTLALVAIEKGDSMKALKEAEIGVKSSDRHPFYLAVQAAAFELAGKKTEADNNIKEAYKRELPTEDQLKGWFFKGKPLDLLLTVFKRQKQVK